MKEKNKTISSLGKSFNIHKYTIEYLISLVISYSKK